MSDDVLYRLFWDLLHRLSFLMSERKDDYDSLLQHLVSLISCEECSTDADAFVKRSNKNLPPAQRGLDLHNHINIKTNKPQWALDKLESHYQPHAPEFVATTQAVYVQWLNAIIPTLIYTQFDALNALNELIEHALNTSSVLRLDPNKPVNELLNDVNAHFNEHGAHSHRDPPMQVAPQEQPQAVAYRVPTIRPKAGCSSCQSRARAAQASMRQLPRPPVVPRALTGIRPLSKPVARATSKPPSRPIPRKATKPPQGGAWAVGPLNPRPTPRLNSAPVNRRASHVTDLAGRSYLEEVARAQRDRINQIIQKKQATRPAPVPRAPHRAPISTALANNPSLQQMLRAKQQSRRK